MVFFGCRALESITIPIFITEIEFGAFCQCLSLKSITIPKSVTKIGTEAFADCFSLRYVTIPARYKSTTELERIFGKRIYNVIDSISFTFT